MKHARYVWLAFACCSAVVLAAMGWISLTAWRSEQAETVAREQEAEARRLEAEALRKEAETRRQAAVEENVRLALWRIDTTLAPLIAQESARPYFAYRSFLTADRAYARMFNNDRNGNETLIPSPLLADISPNVLLYFQFEPDGRLTSPQVPLGGNRKLAVPQHADQQAIKEAEKRTRCARQAGRPRQAGGAIARSPPGTRANRAVAAGAEQGTAVQAATPAATGSATVRPRRRRVSAAESGGPQQYDQRRGPARAATTDASRIQSPEPADDQRRTTAR